jgi:alpha-glucosidase
MDGRDLVRSMTWAASAGAARRMRAAGAAWLGRRSGIPAPRQGAGRARVPGAAKGGVPGPGGGVVIFARSRLRIMVAVNGAAFWGWDDAGPEPSYALGGAGPEPDPRAVLEPDKDGGWRVVAERVTVAVTRFGTVEVRTPGGVWLRRALPPRWWEPVAGGPARWLQRSEVAPDARFFGLGARSAGPRLPDGTYALGSRTEAGRPFSALGAPGQGADPPGRGADPPGLAMPVQFVVADAAAHLMFHDNTSDGAVTWREGAEGAGSGHDRAGACELRMDGGPLRCWVMVGSPARVLRTWASLTGPAALPPEWALGHQHVVSGPAGESRGEGFRRPVTTATATATATADAVAGRADAAPGEPAPGERPFVLSRSGWAGLQRYGGAWTGDTTAGWPGLRATLSTVVGLGLCGVPYAGGDVGGDVGRAADGSSAELYLRWLQLGSYLPLFRTRGGDRGDGEEPDSGVPREFGSAVTGHARACLAERRRLTPYFVTLAHLARRTGAPWVRPMWWAAPEDRALRDCQDAFLLGDCLLVAPVLDPGTLRRTVRLPRGRWYDTATEKVYEGPGRVTVEAPLSRIPVLARAGAVVPVRSDDEDEGIVLEVWQAAPGRGGGGLVAVGTEGAGGEARIERYVTRRQGGRTVVQRQPEDGTSGPPHPVRVRGVGRP